MILFDKKTPNVHYFLGEFFLSILNIPAAWLNSDSLPDFSDVRWPENVLCVVPPCEARARR